MNDLISPKPFEAFTPDEYHSYVCSMWELRTKGRKPPAPAPGLTVSRAKSGKITVRRSKNRAFDYVTMREIELLAKAKGFMQSDLWNAFRARKFIIAKDRLTAEAEYGRLKEETNG